VVRCITLIFCVFFAMPGHAQPVPLFSATYKVSYGILRGEMTLELRQEDRSAYVYEQPGGAGDGRLQRENGERTSAPERA
jgi:hypothetical protein